MGILRMETMPALEDGDGYGEARIEWEIAANGGKP
jgi:hypothetical protein